MDADQIAATLNDLDQLIAIHIKCSDIISAHIDKIVGPDL